MFDDAAVEAADRAARIWAASEPGPIAPGSEAHKTAFCRMLLDTHNPYKPAIIEWPALDAEARDRLVSLPIWDIAVQTEGKARLRVLSYAASDRRPAAAARRSSSTASRRGATRRCSPTSSRPMASGWRPSRNIAARAIRNGPSWSPASASASTASSPSACSRWRKRSGFFPPALVDTFEPVMQEEGRHILFFVNWVAWHRRNLPWWRRPLFAAKVAGGLGVSDLGAHRHRPRRRRRGDRTSRARTTTSP